MPATLQRLPAPPSAWPRHAEPATLIDELLAEQSTLRTPVARFSDLHDRSPDLVPHYRTLIPLTLPGPGEQYAFEVSLDRCTGCKACVSACHSLNGLDDHEAWRDTGLLLGGTDSPGWQQTITTACHHCEEPGCMSGCPVGAYEKDRITGIVRHLDDQCIGCSYCILKCPYDVPKYSKKRGIVRKCDMCHQRLADGEAPACVQACPTEAIRIVAVNKDNGTDERQPQPALFPTSIHNHRSSIPDSSITRPTTRYVSRHVPATAIAADRNALTPQHTHWPLIMMLVLTQAGIGLCGGAIQTTNPPDSIPPVGAALFYLGMAASVFHLGQPLKAWRFFLGLKTSWLSREILAFALFAPIPFLLCILPFLPEFPLKSHFSLLTSHSALPMGLAAIFTSVMIYHDTRRALWSFQRGAIRFFGTVASFAAFGNLMKHPDSLHAELLLAGVILVKLIPELHFLRHRHQQEWTPDAHSARLQLGPLRHLLIPRFGTALVTIPIAIIQPWAALPFLLIAEILERQLFFQSVQAPKMPGSFAPAAPVH